MTWLTSFLTGLLSDIIRPIIQDELKELKDFAIKNYDRLKTYEKFDAEAYELTKSMAEASTSEERYAILSRIKDARAVINS